MKKALMRCIIPCVFLLLGMGYTQAQTVSGTVTDDQQKPLAKVSVIKKGSSVGTSTDEAGKYTITAVSGDVLEFSSVGYQPASLTVGSSGNGDIQLMPSISDLTDVVVVGYGTQRKKDLTGSVAVVDMQDLKKQPSASPIEALQGKATGVQIINDGAPGSTPQIRIRGFSTINNNDPLYVIDGMPYEGKLSWLNANDIESMQVLKDASAASIYGSRANNGVVIITTKKGKKGPAKVTLDMYYGTQRPNRSRFPEFLTPQQFAEYLYTSFRNSGRTPGSSETTGTNYGTDPNTPTLPDYLLAGPKTGQTITAADADPSKYNYVLSPASFYQITRANKEGTHWFDEITQNAPMQNYQLSVMGGGENSTYALSGGYFSQLGTIKYTDFKRYTIRSNSTFSLLENHLTLGQNIQYSYTNSSGFGTNPNVAGSYQSEGTPVGFAYRLQTIVPVYDIMGNFAGTRGDKLGNAQNPLAMLYRSKDDQNNSGQFFGSAFADLKIIEGLNLRSTYGVRYETYNGLSIGYPNPEFAEGSFITNTLSEYQGYTSEWTWSNTATFKKSFKNHDFTLLAGTEAVESKGRGLNGNGNDFFITGDLNYYYLNTAATRSSGSSGYESALFSIFGRLDYGYLDKYLVSATVRRDGSSNFGPNHQYGTFPAASIAWRLSNEEFMKSATWINDLKLRAGYGVTGNQRIPAFQYLKRYRSGLNQSFYPIGGGNDLISGIWTGSYDNPDVKWEERKSLNLGLDFALFNRKIDGSIEWFNNQTTDMLYPVPLPSVAAGTGSSPFVNAGDAENKGFEISANYHYLAAAPEGFQFDVGVNFSKYTNKIIQLAPNINEQPYLTIRGVTTSILKAGAPLGAFYGYNVIGIYQSAEDIAATPSYNNARIGGFKFQDVNNDGVINGSDRTVIGNPHPDFIYSLSFNSSYKRFDVSMFFNGSQGNDLFDVTRQYTDFNAFDGAVSTRVLDAWSPTNTGSMMPSPYRGAPTLEYAASSYYVQDGSFFRMRNLQIGYSFPTDKMFNGKINNMRVYVTGTNLFTLTKYSGLDPEVSQYSSTFTAPGVDIGVYPVPRQYLFGLSVTF